MLTEEERLERQRAKTHRHNLKVSDITSRFEERYKKINWTRRRSAEKNIIHWVNTYCIGLLLNTPPPKKGEQVLREMDQASKSRRLYNILMGRGSGKSSYVECVTLKAVATGEQKFVVVVSQNQNSAISIMNDIFHAIMEQDSALAQDYPEICAPFHIAEGSYRKHQTMHGKETYISKTQQQLVFADNLTDLKGNRLKNCGAAITVRGITSGVRGLRHRTQRPTLVLLDDIQDSSTASSPSLVDKLVNTIKKDIIPLGGKQRLSILQTATPICPDDLVDILRKDNNWQTTLFPAIIKYPSKLELWDEYFKLYDQESVTTRDHSGSLDFYRNHKKEMDNGAEVFNPTNYSTEDGHDSALQKLLEIRHVIGEAAFDAEYQMSPHAEQAALNISPNVVVKKTNQHPRLFVPDGFIYTIATSDINSSYAITTTITAFKTDTTAVVIYHHVTKCSIDNKLTETEYSQQLYNKLTEVGNELKALQVPLTGWSIDAGGRNFQTVCTFVKNCIRLVGIKAAAFVGRASTNFNPLVRSRLRDAIGQTVLCGNDSERQKAGSGNKYTFFDADTYKEMAQKAFLAQVGSAGSCSLYKAREQEHTDFAIQLCNEKLTNIRTDSAGKVHYTWKTNEPHDYLDCMSMAFATVASLGVSPLKHIKSTVRPVIQRKKRVRVI